MKASSATQICAYLPFRHGEGAHGSVEAHLGKDPNVTGKISTWPSSVMNKDSKNICGDPESQHPKFALKMS